MKLKILLASLLLVALASPAQRVMVAFYTNAPQIPNGWPARVEPCGTNTAILAGFHTNFTVAVYENYRAALEPWMNASNNAAQVQMATVKSASLAEATELFNRLPQGLTAVTAIGSSNLVIEASLASGTNNLAQLTTRVRQLNGNVITLNTIQSNVLLLLQKTGPAIKQAFEATQ